MYMSVNCLAFLYMIRERERESGRRLAVVITKYGMLLVVSKQPD
jgi:hypothetical protein